VSRHIQTGGPGNGFSSKKRRAQSKVVEMILPEQKMTPVAGGVADMKTAGAGYSTHIPTTPNEVFRHFISERAEGVPFGHGQKTSRIPILETL
jgi:hypothetical protein